MNGAVVTIRDVARVAGCSIATVSRVATGSVPVADATRQRVIAAALSLNFPLGRGPSASRAVLGVLVPSLANPVFAAALAGIERCARLRGVSTVIAQSHYLPEGEDEGVRALMAERPRGLILTVCDPATSRALGEIAAQRLPAATIYNGSGPAGVRKRSSPCSGNREMVHASITAVPMQETSPRRKVRGKFLHERRPRPAAGIRPSPSAATACAASPCAEGARPARPSRICAGARIRPRSPRRARPVMGAHYRADPPTSGEEGRSGAGASGMRGNGRGRRSLEREVRAAPVKGLGSRA